MLIAHTSRLAGVAALAAVAIQLTGSVRAQAPAAPNPAPAASGGEAVEPAPKPLPKDALIEIESRFFEIPDGTARQLGLLSVPEGEGGGKAGQPSKPAPPVPTVGAILEPVTAKRLLQAISDSKDVNLLSAPRVSTRTGQRAVIEVIREFRYPTEFEFEKGAGIMTPKAFETRNLGVTLEVEPRVEADGTINLNLVPQVVKLDGYIRASDGQPVPLRDGRSVGADLTLKDFETVKYPRDTVLQPIFSTNKLSTSVSLASGQTVVLGGMRKDAQIAGKPAVIRLLYVIITARRVEAPAGAAARGLPVAFINKTDAEGFVRSPFAPEANPIDARGLPAGTELKCPVTKRLFRLQ